ncbi:prephenate dehydratase [Geosmithia morbida]|uniref:prephenate dehydratase n=1 Tax=Geosmithia morbida TaxID=1094350 RepID=A0A9P4YWA8_9HYPO|nr:prephenate dehydratase [Geosmithia morbida]KAF4123205.1 prephenate dehydratase [Geosmithia morbida]
MTSGDEKPVVAYLGPPASYSHQVSSNLLVATENLELTFGGGDVFDIVQDGGATAGVVPFENSTNGSVVFTLDDLADRNGRYRDIRVVGEVYVDVHHCLLGHLQRKPRPETGGSSASTAASAAAAAAAAAAVGGGGGGGGGLDDSNVSSGTCTPTAADPRPAHPRTKPLGSLDHIKRLYSHPQAFGQCTAFISTYLKGVEVFEVSSTSRAAEMVRADETGTWAAISSQLAAEVHGLDFLGRSIEDRSDNTTRFLIIRKVVVADEAAEAAEAAARSSSSSWTASADDDGWAVTRCTPLAVGAAGAGTKSLVSFSVPHDSPGALAEVLGCFRAFDLNLTSINSRPSLDRPFQYIFFVEFEGHRNKDPEGRVKGALDKIDGVAASWRWLGSWE